MDIGGYDLVLEGTPQPEDIDLALRHFAEAWPEGLVDAPGVGPVTPLASPPATLKSAKEVTFFVYRDRASFDAWQEEGLTEANASAIIWVTLSEQEGAISFVVDDRDSPSGRIVTSLMLRIENRRLQNALTKAQADHAELKKLVDAFVMKSNMDDEYVIALIAWSNQHKDDEPKRELP
jgi:hypothetical protein